MTSQRLRDIKHAQRESFFLKELSSYFTQIALDEPALRSLSISRVSLSPNRGVCTIYFIAENGKKEFEEKKEQLILYKPSMRASLSKALQTRYTPQLVFKYDETFEKQKRLEEIFDQIKEEKSS